MTKYLSIDAEMGGRDLNFSLLTVGLVVLDNLFTVCDTLELFLKPDDGIYTVSGQGMSVNHINIAEHDAVAMPYKTAKPILFEFLRKSTDNGKCRLVPLGHGVKGDISHVQSRLISEGSWHQFCSYHYIDTSVVLQFLRSCGKLPFDTDGSVESLARHFNIEVKSDSLHNALYDAQLTAAIYKQMVNLVQ